MDSAGCAEKVMEAAERHQAVFTLTANTTAKVVAAIHQLARNPQTPGVQHDALGPGASAAGELRDLP